MSAKGLISLCQHLTGEGLTRVPTEPLAQSGNREKLLSFVQVRHMLQVNKGPGVQCFLKSLVGQATRGNGSTHRVLDGHQEVDVRGGHVELEESDLLL